MINLSICIPTYNRCDKICESLRRMVSNIKEDCEIVVCDNASTDETENKVKEICNEFKCVKYYKNNKNIGPDENFKKVLSLAKGKYCFLLGDDDYLKNSFFDDIMPFLRQNDFSFISLIHKEDPKFNKMDQIITSSNVQDYIRYLKVNITFMSQMIFNRANLTHEILNGDYVTNLFQTSLVFRIIKRTPNKKFTIINYVPFCSVGVNESLDYNLYDVFVTKLYRTFLINEIADSQKEMNVMFKKTVKTYLLKFTILQKVFGNKYKINKEAFTILKKYPFYWFELLPVYYFPSIIYKFLYNCYKRKKGS